MLRELRDRRRSEDPLLGHRRRRVGLPRGGAGGAQALPRPALHPDSAQGIIVAPSPVRASLRTAKHKEPIHGSTFISESRRAASRGRRRRGSRSRSSCRSIPGRPQKWRTFEVTTRVDVLMPGAPRASGCRCRRWTATTRRSSTTPGRATPQARDRARRQVRRGHALRRVARLRERAGTSSCTAAFATRDRAVDFGSRAWPALEKLSPQARKFCTRRRPSYMPTDGIVRRPRARSRKGHADRHRQGARDLRVDRRQHLPRSRRSRGCGLGDIKTMLETGNLGGKCADLNALYVGLRARGRAAGARRLRRARREVASSATAAWARQRRTSPRAQHCRAEVYLTGYGWVPVDPGRRAQGRARGEAAADSRSTIRWCRRCAPSCSAPGR